MKKTNLFAIGLFTAALSFFAACGNANDNDSTEDADTSTMYQDTSSMTVPADTSHATDTSTMTDTTRNAP